MYEHAIANNRYNLHILASVQHCVLHLTTIFNTFKYYASNKYCALNYHVYLTTILHGSDHKVYTKSNCTETKVDNTKTRKFYMDRINFVIGKNSGLMLKKRKRKRKNRGHQFSGL